MNSVVHQQRRLRLFASVFVCLASPAWAQDITAVPAKKMAPEQCPGDCIQISGTEPRAANGGVEASPSRRELANVHFRAKHGTSLSLHRV